MNGDELLEALGQELRQERTANQEPPVGEAPDADLEAQILHTVEATWARESAESAAEDSTPAGPALSEEPETSASVIPISRWWIGGGSAITGLAAAMLLVVQSSVDPDVSPSNLPTYTFELRGGLASARGSRNTERAPRLAAHSEIELMLRPKTDTPQSVTAVMAVRQAGRLTPLSASFEVSPNGALRWTGTAQALFGELRGELELVTVTGPPPLDPQTVLRSEFLAAPPPGVQVFTNRVTLIDTSAARKPSADPILWGGCQTVHAGSRCELNPARTLTIWVPTSKTVELTVDDAPIDGGAQALDGGQVMRVQVPSGARQLSIAATPGAPLYLPLEDNQPDPVIAEARSLRQNGDLKAAQRLLEADGLTHPNRRGLAEGLLGRMARTEGRLDDAAAALTRAIEDHRATGRISNEAHDRFVLADVRIKQRDYKAARRALDPEAPCFAGSPEARISAHYYRGLVAKEAGDIRHALEHLKTARQLGRRLGLGYIIRAAEQLRAAILQGIGRLDEASRIFERLLTDGSDRGGCEDAELFANRAWSAALPVEAGRRPAQDVLALMDDSLTRYQEKCPEPARLANAHVNRALVRVAGGDRDGTRSDLAAIRQVLPTPNARLRSWIDDIEARVHLLEKNYGRALDLYQNLGARVTEPEDRWRVRVGWGRALEAAGRLNDARDQYKAAENALHESADFVPLGGGRGLFLDGHRTSASHLVALAEAQGAPHHALETIRKARLRALMRTARAERIGSLAVEKRDRWEMHLGTYHRLRDALKKEHAQDWTLSTAALETQRPAREAQKARIQDALQKALDVLELPELDAETTLVPVPPEDLILALHPLPIPQTWLLVGARGASAWTERLALSSPDTSSEGLADQLTKRLAKALERHGADIDAANQIRVLAVGMARQIDVHAVTVGGLPLIEHRPVVYPLDLPWSERKSPSHRNTLKQALVVFDPTGDLLAARREGQRLAERLSNAGWVVNTLYGRAAQAPAVLRHLDAVSLFHFAGHGAFRGMEGLQSVLELASNTEITAAEIWARPHAPRTVVLASCESENPGKHGGAAELGWARAFLFAGARQVIAAVRPVQDDTAAALVTQLYDLNADPPISAESLQTAQVELRRRALADWAVFRSYVP